MIVRVNVTTQRNTFFYYFRDVLVDGKRRGSFRFLPSYLRFLEETAKESLIASPLSGSASVCFSVVRRPSYSRIIVLGSSRSILKFRPRWWLTVQGRNATHSPRPSSLFPLRGNPVTLAPNSYQERGREITRKELDRTSYRCEEERRGGEEWKGGILRGRQVMHFMHFGRPNTNCHGRYSRYSAVSCRKS